MTRIHEQLFKTSGGKDKKAPHADIGKWLAEKWNLPATVSDTVMYHHAPSLAQSNERHVCIVHIADYLVSLCIIRPTEQDYKIVFDPVSLEVLGMSDGDLNDITAEIRSGGFFKGLFMA